jgi:hypothetical protein
MLKKILKEITCKHENAGVWHENMPIYCPDCHKTFEQWSDVEKEQKE